MIVNANDWRKVQENLLLEEEIPLRWLYMQDNDPKHVSHKAKTWFRDNNICVLNWPSQSSELNPNEDVWVELKKTTSTAMPQNTDDLWRACQAE
ncbi:putative phosphatidylinositol-3,4-bisphosphate 4-phosphatase [Trypoxylus dichotomus]